MILSSWISPGSPRDAGVFLRALVCYMSGFCAAGSLVIPPAVTVHEFRGITNQQDPLHARLYWEPVTKCHRPKPGCQTDAWQRMHEMRVGTYMFFCCFEGFPSKSVSSLDLRGLSSRTTNAMYVIYPYIFLFYSQP